MFIFALLLTFLLPSYLYHPKMIHACPTLNVLKLTYSQSLRGLASIGVLTSHLTIILAQYMTEACCAPASTSPSLFQLPPLRLLAAAQSHVALFFVLSGFCSTLTPLRLARGSELSAAHAHLGHAALVRPLRFVLPASAVTVVSWVVCQLDGYVAARRVGKFLLSTSAPLPSASWVGAVGELVSALVGTWRWGGPENVFEPMQYVLVWMLQGSYIVYMTLIMTLGLKSSRGRIGVVLVVLALSWGWSLRIVDPFVGQSYLAGVLLAELWVSEAWRDGERYARWASPGLLGIGLVLMSWPKNRAESLTWTRLIQRALVDTLPRVLDAERLVGTIGVLLVILGVMISPRIRISLAHPFLLWLGRISFAIYLLHMLVLRLAMPWLLFISNPAKALFLLGSGNADAFKAVVVDEPGLFRKILGLLTLILLILTAAHQWTQRVEPRLDRISKVIEEAVTGSTRQARDEASTYQPHVGLPNYHRPKPV